MVLVIDNNHFINLKHSHYERFTLHYCSYPDNRMGNWIFCLLSRRSNPYSFSNSNHSLAFRGYQESVNEFMVNGSYRSALHNIKKTIIKLYS